ncbi:MAG: Do family serine endopeptidase [Gammaproteobacteria bacterium]|nr:Do family serine endopeptidase [Gammaproteobacteria bacterium]
MINLRNSIGRCRSNSTLTREVFKAVMKLLTGILLLVLSTSHAALPVAVDGEELPSLAPMLERVTPAVVNIATRGQSKRRIELPLANDPLFRRFFDIPAIERVRETSSLGSGVIIDSEQGYILTNHHVIEHAYQITVTLTDGRALSAEIIGRDADTDIAVIRVAAEDLHAVKLANSKEVRVGDFVVAIGNPYGLGQTVTSGIVSALGRSGLGIESYEDFIQTDASINLGNSGGALVNLRGELVGINTAIYAGGNGNAGSIGIGFAIPINMAHDIMLQLIKHGEVKRGRFGAQGQDLTPQLAQAFGIELSNGFIVTQIESASPAARAGLEVGDVIVSANDRKIRSADDIHNLVGLLRIGQSIDLELYRDGKMKQLTAVIESINIEIIDGAELHEKLAGAQIGEMRETRLQRGVVAYLQVQEVVPGSNAWNAGIRAGDVFYSINKQLIRTFDEAQEVIESNRRGLILTIHRGNRELFLLIENG